MSHPANPLNGALHRHDNLIGRRRRRDRCWFGGVGFHSDSLAFMLEESKMPAPSQS